MRAFRGRQSFARCRKLEIGHTPHFSGRFGIGDNKRQVGLDERYDKTRSGTAEVIPWRFQISETFSRELLAIKENSTAEAVLFLDDPLS